MLESHVQFNQTFAGYEVQATVTCPYNLLADYTFGYTDSGSLLCIDTDTGTLSMCGDATKMAISPLSCSPSPLYSGKEIYWNTIKVTLLPLLVKASFVLSCH